MKLFKNSKIITFKELNSTNKYASELPMDIEEGTAIVAEYQSAGRGQASNFWESEAGKNLTLSIVLQPKFLKAADQFYISKITSISIADLVSLYTKNIFIKWPNDIYAGDRKISGILIENALSGNHLLQSIIGIGLNINQEKFTSNALNPVSLKQLTNKEYALNELLNNLLEKIEHYYTILKNKDLKSIDEKYLAYLYRFQQSSLFAANGVTFQGTIIGVEKTGELLVKEDNGLIKKFMHKEVEFL